MNGPVFIALLAALWAGFVLAISFMESWLKFRAKGVTVETGLAIGILVFKALNWVEWGIFVCTWLSVFTCTFPGPPPFLSISLLAFILAGQTFILLPHLSRRARLRISRKKIPPSHAHHFFVGSEIAKLVLLACLIARGIGY